VKLDRRWVVIFFAGILALIPNACGESVTVGCGSSVAVSEGSSAEGILASDGSVTQSSVSSVGVIDNLNIDPWVRDSNGDYAEIGVTGTNLAGYSYSDSFYPGQGSGWTSNGVAALQGISVSSADSLNAYALASNSAGDKAGASLSLLHGSLKNYYNAAYAGPASWLGIDKGAFVQQTLDNANGNAIQAQTWAIDPAGDAAGALTSVENGALNGYSVQSAAAQYSNGLSAAGVSVDSMSASVNPMTAILPSGATNQVLDTYDSKGDTSMISLDKATTITGYTGKTYAYDATATATETGHVTGPFVGTASVDSRNPESAATKTRTPNFGSEYDLSMSATTGSAPTGTLGYYINPNMATSTLGAIQGAVNAAQSGDTINAAAGTYNGNVVLDKSLSVIGDIVPIDGLITNQIGTISITDPTAVVTYTNWDITQGTGNPLPYPYNQYSVGGGIFNMGTLSLEKCAIHGNTATAGGGIFNMGTLSLEKCAIYSNTATVAGGGIFNTGTVTMDDTTSSSITGNTAYGYGGGIFNAGTVNGNTALIKDNNEAFGGDIYTYP